jgi:hypothetical protein
MESKLLITIPYQTLEIGRIHLGGFRQDMKERYIAPLTYKDSTLEIDDFILLSPILKVLDYNMITGRLRLDTTDQRQFSMKMNTFQQYIVSTIYINRMSYLHHDYSMEEVNDMFQVLLNGDAFSIFVYPTATVRNDDGTITHIQMLKAGDSIRFPLYIHGIMSMAHLRGTRFRIQHNVPYVWKIKEAIC